MRFNYYIVTFTNKKTVFVKCFNKEEAEILAKTVMIKHGLTREVESIIETKNPYVRAEVDFIDM